MCKFFGVLNDTAGQVAERVSTGRWLGDCFVYVNANDRLNYCVVSQFTSFARLLEGDLM